MTITLIKEEERDSIIEYLLGYEKFCVSLLSDILHGGKSIYVVRGNFGEIHGVFSWWMGRSILHCLPDVNGRNHIELEQAFSKFFLEHTIKYLFAVIGEQSGTDFIRKVIFKTFNKEPDVQIEYYLQENRRFDSRKNLDGMNHQLSFSVCTMDEADKAFKVHAEYEKEEVLIPGQEFDEPYAREKFELFVESGAVYLGKIKNTILTKASISAMAKNYYMLGGVYTVPKYRNHGIAKAMVNYMTTKFEKENKTLVLYVKKDNAVALKLYQDTGFKTVCDWKILYY
jgi:ribosomal protein S18 acetylase RimI-like enzyme